MNETFFSTFRDLDPRNNGVLTPTEIPRAMSTACRLMTMKMDIDRYCKNVYNIKMYNDYLITQLLPTYKFIIYMSILHKCNPAVMHRCTFFPFITGDFISTPQNEGLCIHWFHA